MAVHHKRRSLRKQSEIRGGPPQATQRHDKELRENPNKVKPLKGDPPNRRFGAKRAGLRVTLKKLYRHCRKRVKSPCPLTSLTSVCCDSSKINPQAAYYENEEQPQNLDSKIQHCPLARLRRGVEALSQLQMVTTHQAQESKSRSIASEALLLKQSVPHSLGNSVNLENDSECSLLTVWKTGILCPCTFTVHVQIIKRDHDPIKSRTVLGQHPKHVNVIHGVSTLQGASGLYGHGYEGVSSAIASVCASSSSIGKAILNVTLHGLQRRAD